MVILHLVFKQEYLKKRAAEAGGKVKDAAGNDITGHKPTYEISAGTWGPVSPPAPFPRSELYCLAMSMAFGTHELECAKKQDGFLLPLHSFGILPLRPCHELS